MFRRKKKEGAAQQALEMPAIEFKPQAADKQAAQGILIAARGIEQYPVAVVLLAQAIDARADQILLDFSQQGAAVRFRIDGLWESMPPLERPEGDGALIVIKRLVGLNGQDRRSRQQGTLAIKYKGNDWILDVMTQGVPSGERALIRIDPKKPVLVTLSDLGMREKMQQQLKNLLNSDDALFLFSGAPGHALPTTWRVGLESADRFVRDFHAVEDVKLNDPELINITKHTFDSAAGETPMTVLKSLLLKQPDALILPELFSPEVTKLLCNEVIAEHRYVITRIAASSAVEGLLKLLASNKESFKELLKITCGVLNQKLVRRLCTECRQPFQPSPQLLQKLGIPAGRVHTLYQPYIPPPPEQRVDANGKPIEIEICAKCNGRGYYGRAAIFELLQITDEIRQAVLQDPTPANVSRTARQGGFLTMQEEGVLAVATGLTSLQELQRVLSPPKKSK
ncbi:ATPase, T2SS/T4P/T4SS family [Aureliella helgolandensis]|uniref:Type II secretion system protein E n=1 Tax=Aureliella helgolandensis TaxID=2527968 RepID=A0A518G248_9BACT|nr:ATPase, T2SS/T4P/T4SS family [Aureliella helgolandensis]QDV22652.1 Putative type II secretion system protein E [Aureliella helgolandensis]